MQINKTGIVIADRKEKHLDIIHLPESEVTWFFAKAICLWHEKVLKLYERGVLYGDEISDMLDDHAHAVKSFIESIAKYKNVVSDQELRQHSWLRFVVRYANRECCDILRYDGKDMNEDCLSEYDGWPVSEIAFVNEVSQVSDSGWKLSEVN